MMSVIRKTYGVSRNVTIHFEKDGVWQLTNHPINDRVQDQTVMDYVSSIREFGYMPGMRGHAWAMLGPDARPPYLLISFDKLNRAIQYCSIHHADDDNVQRTLRSGLPDVELFSHRMPDDCVVYLRDKHNSMHGGSKTSFLEWISIAEKAEVAFKAQCIINGWTTRQAGGITINKRLAEFLASNYKDTFGTSTN
eukprot:5040178-Karenia_brevis.AAC.1